MSPFVSGMMVELEVEQDIADEAGDGELRRLGEDP
jgi:hypothetical protein